MAYGLPNRDSALLQLIQIDVFVFDHKVSNYQARRARGLRRDHTLDLGTRPAAAGAAREHALDLRLGAAIDDDNAVEQGAPLWQILNQQRDVKYDGLHLLVS